MRIGLFIDGSFLPSREGATQRIYLLAKYLQKAGIDVIVFHCYRGWSDIELIKLEDFTTYILPSNIYYENVEFISQIVEEEKINVIQMCDPILILNQGLSVKQKTSVKLIWEVHEIVSSLLYQMNDEQTNFHKKLEYYTSLCCDKIICFTKEDCNTLVNNGISSSLINIFPCGIDVKERKFFGSNPKSNTVLFLGNMFYEPNYRGVLSIIKYIYPKLYKFVLNHKIKFVGTYPKELIQYQNSNISFTGPINDFNLIFNDITLALAPIEIFSGMRIKILDYMAAGLPVIATSNASTGIKYDNSIIIENNIHNYSNIILKLFKAPKQMDRLGNLARFQIEKYHNWNKIIDDLIFFYLNVSKCNSIFPEDRILNEIYQLNCPIPFWLHETFKKNRFDKKEYPNFYQISVIRKGQLLNL